MTGYHLGPKAKAAGFRLAAFDSVGSTSIEAENAAKAGDPGDIWFAALKQTTGRGRRGRVWDTPHGNMAASLLIRPDFDAAHGALLGFVAGVALNRALKTVLPTAVIKTGIDGADGRPEDIATRIALKWPNDVLVDGAKLAGILLEAGSTPEHGASIVVGMGVNVVSAPTDVPYPATSVDALGVSTSAEAIFTELADQWVDVFFLWDNGHGNQALLDEWRAGAAGIGAEVAIKTHNSVLRGVFETIDADGRLIVKTNDGQRHPIAAGDVHFGTTASIR